MVSDLNIAMFVILAGSDCFSSLWQFFCIFVAHSVYLHVGFYGNYCQGFPRVKKQGVANYFDLPPLKGWQIGMAGQK